MHQSLKFSIIACALFLLFSSGASAQNRNLVIVNTLGETADFINLVDSTVTLFFDALGLFPNDFVVSGDVGVAINSGSNDLFFYHLPSLSRTGTLFLGSGRNPWAGAFLHPDTLYITNFISSTITQVHVPSRTIITEFPVGDALDSDSPEGILILNRKAYICLASFDDLFEYDQGKIEVYDLNTHTLIKRITVGINPQVIRLGYDGYLYVVCTGNYAAVEGRLFKLDPATDVLVDSLSVGGYPGSIALTKQGVGYLSAGGFASPAYHHLLELKSPALAERVARAKSSGGIVFTVDLNTFSVLHGPANPLFTDFGVTSVTAVSDSTVVTVNFSSDTVTEIDSAGNIRARFSVGDGPVAAAKYPDCFVPKGDADNSGSITISDAVWLTNFIFAGGPAPGVLGSGDMDCNGIVTIGDAVAIVTFIFSGDFALCGCAD